MITVDQPTCFDNDLLVAISSRSDGTMLDRRNTESGDIISHRAAFCRSIGISYDDVVFQWITYGDDKTYAEIRQVDGRDTTKHTDAIQADGLFTNSKNVAMLLPVADCIATVMHDPVAGHLALLHMGRHSTVAGLVQRGIDTFLQHGSRPENIIVWMSPSAQAETYVMEYFDHAPDPAWQPFCQRKADGIHLDMQGYNAAICQRAGIPAANIHRSPINTMTNPDYFSHARGDTSGRTAVVAMMRPLTS